MELLINTGAPYGSSELKAMYQKYVMRAMLVAGLLHGLGLGVYWGSIWLAAEKEPVRMVRITKYSQLGPPPSITNSSVAPAISAAGPTAKPSVGIPVPVPDAEISPEQTIMSQTEMAQQAAPVVEGEGTGSTQVQQDIKIEDQPNEEPADFVPVEKEPQIVKRVEPVYPELAVKAGIEGTVYIKAWVDKEGKVKKALVQKSNADILNQAALDAVYKWTFTPAMMNNGPVDVWMSIPFKFRLQNR